MQAHGAIIALQPAIGSVKVSLDRPAVYPRCPTSMTLDGGLGICLVSTSLSQFSSCPLSTFSFPSYQLPACSALLVITIARRGRWQEHKQGKESQNSRLGHGKVSRGTPAYFGSDCIPLRALIVQKNPSLAGDTQKGSRRKLEIGISFVCFLPLTISFRYSTKDVVFIAIVHTAKWH